MKTVTTLRLIIKYLLLIIIYPDLKKNKVSEVLPITTVSDVTRSQRIRTETIPSDQKKYFSNGCYSSMDLKKSKLPVSMLLRTKDLYKNTSSTFIEQPVQLFGVGLKYNNTLIIRYLFTPEVIM